MAEKSLEDAKNAFFIALGIDMAVTGVVLASYSWMVGVLNGIAAGGPAASPSVIGNIEFWEHFSKAIILTMFGVGWALIHWLNACYTYAKEPLRATGLRHERWKTWGWIVPIWNLFKPYQVLNEIYKVGAIGGVESDDWKKSSSSGLLLTWWIFWLISHMVMMNIAKEILKSSSLVGLNLNQIAGFRNSQIILGLISLGVAGFWFVVAGSLTRRLQERGSKPFKSVVVPSPAAKLVASNDAYAAALAEIEEDRLDKGVWARSFADSGGDESRAKALYIKTRAESTQSSADVWQDTRPPGAEDAGIKAADEVSSNRPRPSPSVVPLSLTLSFVGVAIFGIVVAVALPAYQAYTKRQASPIAFGENDKPAPQLDLSEFQKAPNSQTGTDWDKGLITPPNSQATSVPPLDDYIAEVINLSGRERYDRPFNDMGVKFPMQLGNLAFVSGNFTPKHFAQANDVEHTQTWSMHMQPNANNAFIVFQNRTYQKMKGMVLEVQAEERQCDNKGKAYYMNLFFEKPVPATSVAGVSFSLPAVIPNAHRCMDVVDLIYD